MKTKGISLVEVSVGLGLLGVAAYFFSQLITTSSRGASRVSAKLDFENTSTLVLNLLRTSSNCTTYFGNQVFDASGATLSSQLIGGGGNLFIHMPGDPTNIVVKPGVKITQNIQTVALTLSKFILQAPDKYLASVRIEAAQSNAPKALPLSREFSIEVTTLDVPSSSPPQKRIVSCSGVSGGVAGAAGFEVAQALRTDGAQDTGSDVATNRKIHMLVGPRSAVIALNNVPNHPDSDYAYANDMDGMKCNDADGWYLTGCWNAGSEGDHFAYANGCITNDFDQHSKNDLSINCIKVH